MPNRFANGVRAIAMCDRCGQQYKLKKLKTEIIKQRKYQLLVCEECWDPDQPQLMLGTFPVEDPQALRNPRRDNTYITAGQNNDGFLTGGSRDIQWGWNPVGGSSYFDAIMTPNYLVASSYVGDVTVTLDSIPGPSLSGVSVTGAVGNALGPLAITGVQTTVEAGGVGNLYVSLTGVSATGLLQSASFPITLGVTETFSAAGSRFQYGTGGDRIRIYSENPAQWAVAQELLAELANVGTGQVWIYADAAQYAQPGSAVPELCFGRVSSTATYFGTTVDILIDTSMLPTPAPSTADWWYVYSNFRTELRFSIPCPSNGGIYPDPPYGGYNPVYVNNGATCTLSWSGNAAKSLYGAYQSTASIIGSKVFGTWGTSFYDQQANITIGVVTAVNFSGSTFTITMNTVTAVASPTFYPLTPLSFIPFNPGVAYLSGGVSSTTALANVGKTITMFVSTPSQSVQFQSTGMANSYKFDVSVSNPTTPLGTWASTYGGGYDHVYMFADIGGTYIGLSYMPGNWDLKFGAGSNMYLEGYIGGPLPSSFPGLGIYSFNNFAVARQFYVVGDIANQYASYSAVGGVATFTWTGNTALSMRDFYASNPTLPVGTEISAAVLIRSEYTWGPSQLYLGTFLSMGYSSGTFTLTYTVVNPFVPYPGGTPSVGMMFFNTAGITFLPLVINI